MRSYLTSHKGEAEQVLSSCGWFFANREELAALGGDPEQAQAFRQHWNLDGLVVKAGASGCTVWTADGPLHLPALGGRAVVDVTGAGDALAGGMLAAWLESGGERTPFGRRWPMASPAPHWPSRRWACAAWPRPRQGTWRTGWPKRWPS